MLVAPQLWRNPGQRDQHGRALWGPSHDSLTLCLKSSTHSHSEAQGYPLLKTHPVHFANEEVNFLMSLTEDTRPLGITVVNGQETGSGA